MVDAEAIGTVAAAAVAVRIGPLQQHALEVVAYLGIVEVDHGDADVAAVVALPPRLVEERFGFGMRRVAPDQEVGERRARLAQRLSPPWMPFADVLDLHVQVNLEPACMRRAEQGAVILHRAVGGLDAFEIGGEIIVVVGRWLQWREQDRGDAEVFQIIEFLRQSFQVADAIAVGIAEAAEEHVIEDFLAGLPPWHAQRGTRRSGLRRSGIRGSGFSRDCLRWRLRLARKSIRG